MSIRSHSAPAQPGGPDGGERGSLQLLIVDDDAAQRALITHAARHAGHAVTTVQSCTEAIRQIQTARFDCVTLDLMLEDGDGVEVLRAMAETKFAGSVIVISGMNAARRIAARSYARSLGIKLRSLPKPLDSNAVMSLAAKLFFPAYVMRWMPTSIWFEMAACSRLSPRHLPNSLQGN